MSAAADLRRSPLALPALAAVAGALGALLGGWALSRGASSQVEKSVKAGITAGVDEALSPAAVRERSRQAARGLVDGLVEAATDPGGEAAPGSARAPRAGPDPRRTVAQGARLAGDGARVAGQAARLAGEAAGLALDTGLDVMEALLGPPPGGARDGARPPEQVDAFDAERRR